MAMIATTINSSIRVNPFIVNVFSRICFLLLRVGFGHFTPRFAFTHDRQVNV
jgi:hypothetical protein